VVTFLNLGILFIGDMGILGMSLNKRKSRVLLQDGVSIVVVISRHIFSDSNEERGNVNHIAIVGRQLLMADNDIRSEE
jgi:hypothetical protein